MECVAADALMLISLGKGAVWLCAVMTNARRLIPEAVERILAFKG